MPPSYNTATTPPPYQYDSISIGQGAHASFSQPSHANHYRAAEDSAHAEGEGGAPLDARSFVAMPTTMEEKKRHVVVGVACFGAAALLLLLVSGFHHGETARVGTSARWTGGGAAFGYHDLLNDDGSSRSSPFLDDVPSLSSAADGGGGGGGGDPPSVTQPPPVYLNHSDAYTMLVESVGYHADYFALNAGLDAQVNQAYCAVATSVSVLNSLGHAGPTRGIGVDLPVDRVYSPYPYATQADVFGRCTNENVILEHHHRHHSHDREHHKGRDGWRREMPDIDGVLTPPMGLSLNQAAGLLRCHLDADYWTVNVTAVDPAVVSVDDMRDALMDALSRDDARVLVNYFRVAVGQVGGGHFSPLGAYHPPTDSFLIVDVAKYKYPPAWVTAARLYGALAGEDDCGIWDWPWAQTRLGKYLKRPPKNEGEEEEVRNILGCRSEHRGFIVVEGA